MAKSIVTFQSDYFARPEANTPEEIDAMDANPWGKDLASYVLQELEAQGFHFINREPAITMLVLWFVTGRKGPESFTFLCGCQPINKRDDLGHWVIQFKKHKGCLPTLFGMRPSEEELQPVKSLLQSILERKPQAKELRWFSQKEYGKLLKSELHP